MLADVRTWGANIRGGRVLMRSGRWLCSMLADVQTLGANIRGGRVLMRSASCRVCDLGAVALLDACRRSDVAQPFGAVGSVLSSACRGRSVLMLADVQTLAQSFGAVGHLGECVPWLCSVLMLTDVQTWAQPFGAVVF